MIQYGTFTALAVSGYQPTTQDGIRIQTDATRAKRLINGKWKKRVALGCSLMSRMSRCWLDHHLAHDTGNWDVTLAKLLSIVMVASFGCRAGDVPRSQGYTGNECLCSKYIELKLDPHQG